MKTCVSFMKAIISIKELNIAFEHETVRKKTDYKCKEAFKKISQPIYR